MHELDKDQPGRLIQSIDVKVEVKGTKVTFALMMEDYWRWVDEGRRKGAKQPPIAAMLEFIKVRGLVNKISNKRAKQIKSIKNKVVKKSLKQVSADAKRKQLAFLIARGIKQHGIKPTHFFTDTINQELYNSMKQDLGIAIGKDIEISFKTN